MFSWFVAPNSTLVTPKKVLFTLREEDKHNVYYSLTFVGISVIITVEIVIVPFTGNPAICVIFRLSSICLLRVTFLYNRIITPLLPFGTPGSAKISFETKLIPIPGAFFLHSAC